ncbi:glycosyltransferase family 4 protein [Parabacteroides faecis]|uniref:Glycosyltransferase involved in cell wall biosynthesis n=1 Tax=Parabacteroides faecis TaxID=1217282 RepID=A0ABR6KIB9_9BACT|nr:glycosyltransferase family 4 protein [Parabacteroides faecis]MBB4621124.1 glycosyltransferase involved in cell wall biosynthesis [Parabacteroides faecis]GGJ88997.1 glycosyl transferase [Parabacteroides faecis]
MNKIAIISPCFLPIPALKGGAVETLIEIYLNKNEVNPCAEYVVFTIYDRNAIIESRKYKYSKFEYIHRNTIRHKFLTTYNRILDLLWNRYKFNIPYIGDDFIISCIKIMKYKYKFDTIIIENTPLYALLLKKQYNIPINLHLHNDILYANTYQAKNIIKSLSHIWSTSNYIKKRVCSIPVNSKYNCKISVLYNGIDINRFKSQISINEKNELKNKLSISEKDKILLFVGRIDRTKGVKELIEAFVRLPKSNLKLLILGASFFSSKEKTLYIKELEKMIYPIKNNICFTGYISNEYIHKYYQIADIVIVPSICEEAFSLTCLEALASGCPLIISDSGGMIEVVDEESAIIVDRKKEFSKTLAKQIYVLINDKEKREKMKKAALSRAQMFTDTNYYRNFLELLSDIVYFK